mmetsp:Transcript_2991/g.4622  ORF Transcript_2991/g.4622 Transcript_2991/m.4622 type:complete len:308 (-) Transcript_2991:66-989(-)
MEGSVLGEVGLGVLDVDTVSLGDGGVSLDNVSDLASVSVDELGSPVANVSETLDDEILVLDAKSGVSHLLDEAGNVQQLSDGVVHSQASGLGSSSDSSVGDVLASAAAFIVDVGLTLDILVSVLDPGHHLLVSSHVRTEAINLGPDEALLDQLKGVSAGHALELGIGELSRVDSNTTLGATEGNIGNGELESHETSEGLDFLEVDIEGVSGSTLHGQRVVRVLSSVAGDGLKLSVISNEGDVEPDNRVASFDQLVHVLGDGGVSGGTLQEELDLLQESGLSHMIHILGSGVLGDLGREGGSSAHSLN